MVIWPVLAGSGKTADLVLACFGRFSSHRFKWRMGIEWRNAKKSWNQIKF